MIVWLKPRPEVVTALTSQSLYTPRRVTGGCDSKRSGGWVVRGLTCVQQQPHHPKVGVGHAVVESRVAVPISHVDHMLQQHRRHLRERHQVVRHPRRLSRLGTRDAEPLQLDRVGAGELEISLYFKG